MPLARVPAVLCTLLIAACSSEAPGRRPIRVTAIPDANADTLREDQDRISSWLSGKTGVPVEFMPVVDYAAAVTALRTGQADFGWLGGVTAVQAMRLSGGRVMPLVTRENDLKFKSYIIARADLGASSLLDLKGRTFSFGSKSSTSGHVMPRHFLEQNGIEPERDFARVAYSGDHTRTILDVASGAVDAGAVNYTHFDRMIKEGKVDPAKVKIVWTTPDYVDYCWVARDDLDARCGEGTTAKIKAAFLGLDAARPEDQEILRIQSAPRYIEARAEWWDGIKAIEGRMDLLQK